MNRQAKNRTLIIIFSFLLLLNIALLSYFIFFKGNHPRSEEKRNSYMSEYLKNDLSFSDSQLKQYDSLKAEHQKTTRVLYDSIRLNKQSTFKNIGISGFAHDQQIKFDSSFYKVMSRSRSKDDSKKK